MDKELVKIIKNLKGNLLGIGIESESVISAISKNENITMCFLLESKTKAGKKLFFRGRRKKVNIKKLKKAFKKKKTDTILCNYKYIQKFMKNFVPGSIYINSDKLYIYGDMTKEEIEEIKDKYSRYTKEIEISGHLIIINNKNSKNNFFKDKGYIIKDTIDIILDFITNVLIN